jgi:hypothetical protein
MSNQPKRNTPIAEGQRQQATPHAPVHPVSELLIYQGQMVRALAQGTPWAGGRMPLSFRSSPYRVRVGESRFFASSALDCLRLPALLGEAIEVASICPSSGRAICLIVTEQGVTRQDPPACVMSLAAPRITLNHLHNSPDGSRGEARDLSRFFSSPEAAALWLVAYPGVELLNLDRAWQLANDVAAEDESMSLTGNG